MPMVQGEFFSPFLPPHIWSQEVVNARQMPSTARQIDHVGELVGLGVFFRFFRFTNDSVFVDTWVSGLGRKLSSILFIRPTGDQRFHR